MQKTAIFLAFLTIIGPSSLASGQFGDGEKVVMLDDCDPGDPAWVTAGGCIQDEGEVTRSEFNGERFSSLALSIIGHQAWRNDPAYLTILSGEPLQVRNKGGRGHTFTKVQEFGGGVLTQLNQGLTLAPECANATNVPPGERDEITALTEGNHRFQCCFHPWMRTLVKVKSGN